MNPMRWIGRTAALLSVGLIGMSVMSSNALAQARIVEWSATTNTNPNDDFLALGYVVPLPVDTPLPFDGFRSYSGLFARLQDLAAQSGLVQASVIGHSVADREIWAYRVGDTDNRTVSGSPEPAVLVNGGIHAREWQSPEVVTGIMELLTSKAADTGFYRYLLDNVNVVLIPVLNVDGFLQTQAYPLQNWLRTDPDDPPNSSEPSPRDGRMRRKNMRGADTLLSTVGDHLNGVDLNRNNLPYWASPTGSSADPRSLIYRGVSPQSEPEIQTLVQAADLAPAAQLRLFIDAHSFGRDLLWARTDNDRLSGQTEALLALFANHHRAFPGGRRYVFPPATALGRNRGIGTTDEFFGQNWQIPAWTLEIEPPGNPATHPGEGQCGANYGGVVENCHDGFILPDSQIRRVREQLAETIVALAYRQAGPPALISAQIFEVGSGALVYESTWDPIDANARRQVVHQPQSLQLDRDYRMWLHYDKPMRWRANGVVVPFPGQSTATLTVTDSLTVNQSPLSMSTSNRHWLDQAGVAPEGYRLYADDASVVDFRLPADANNGTLVAGSIQATLSHSSMDMTGQRIDARPATVAHWQNGAWAQYENDAGLDNDRGGNDTSLQIAVSNAPLGAPFLLQTGSSAAWFDRNRSGEGFMLEILSAEQALAYFFTYDRFGEQDWYTMLGTIHGNRIVFPQVARTTGGVFGPGFDPSQIVNTVVGSATFTFASCDQGFMEWQIDGDHGRMELSRLTEISGLPCAAPAPTPLPTLSNLSGSWYDPSHSGEGYVLQLLNNGQALVFWFSYDPVGKRRWFFGAGTISGTDLVFDPLSTTRGPHFGADFNPADFQPTTWGSLRLQLNCQTGLAQYNAIEPGFGSGTLQLRHLTHLHGLPCE